jgi:hypothetical protein
MEQNNEKLITLKHDFTNINGFDEFLIKKYKFESSGDNNLKCISIRLNNVNLNRYMICKIYFIKIKYNIEDINLNILYNFYCNLKIIYNMYLHENINNTNNDVNNDKIRVKLKNIILYQNYKDVIFQIDNNKEEYRKCFDKINNYKVFVIYMLGNEYENLFCSYKDASIHMNKLTNIAIKNIGNYTDFMVEYY